MLRGTNKMVFKFHIDYGTQPLGENGGSPPTGENGGGALTGEDTASQQATKYNSSCCGCLHKPLELLREPHHPNSSRGTKATAVAAQKLAPPTVDLNGSHSTPTGRNIQELLLWQHQSAMLWKGSNNTLLVATARHTVYQRKYSHLLCYIPRGSSSTVRKYQALSHPCSMHGEGAAASYWSQPQDILCPSAKALTSMLCAEMIQHSPIGRNRKTYLCANAETLACR